MQESKLYVGNLNYAITSQELSDLFSSHGEVKDVKVIEGKGFGFVEMADSDQANKAKDALNGTEFKGRPLRIDNARPPKPRENNNNSRGFGKFKKY